MGVYSQELSKEEQREFLKIADEFFSRKGIIFVYPVHGGFMGQDAKILSFGKLKTYDSLAPEFETYETIKSLLKVKREKLQRTHNSSLYFGAFALIHRKIRTSPSIETMIK